MRDRETTVLRPGVDLKFSMRSIDVNTLLGLAKTLGLDDLPLNVLFEKARALGEGNLTLRDLMASVNLEPMSIRTAINRVLTMLENTKLVSDDAAPLVEEPVSKLNEGGVLVIDLSGMSKEKMRLTALLLSAQAKLFEKGMLKPMFLVTKEPYVYSKRAELEDLALQMNRWGLRQIHVTNAPSKLPDLMIRRADNLFCFYLGLKDESRHLAPAAGINEDVFQRTISGLTNRQFLVVGKVTKGEPMVISVKEP